MYAEQRTVGGNKKSEKQLFKKKNFDIRVLSPSLRYIYVNIFSN